MRMAQRVMLASMTGRSAAVAALFAAACVAMGQADPPSGAASPPAVGEAPTPPDTPPDMPPDTPIMLDTVRPPPEGWPPVAAPQARQAGIVELGPPERVRAEAAAAAAIAANTSAAGAAGSAAADARPGRLVLYRTRAKTGWRTPLVSVDGVPLFRPKLDTYTDVALPPGLHRVRVDWARDTGRPDLVFDIRIAPGRSDHVRLTFSYSPTGPNVFELGSFAEWVAPDAAEAELRACCQRVRNEREGRR